MSVPVTFNVRDRGTTPRGFRKAMRAASAIAWAEAGLLFHNEMRDKRFTHAHAAKAGYQERQSKYIRQKLKRFGHTYPLEFSGRTRRLIESAFKIVATSNGCNVRYAGANTLNFINTRARNPINMAMEFTKVLPEEADAIAARFDRVLDRELNANQQTN